jgi:hypothetical protein
MVRYRSRRPSQQPLRTRLRELAGVRLRAGYQQLHVLLRREGWRVNHKRVYRLYPEEGLALRRRRPRRARYTVITSRALRLALRKSARIHTGHNWNAACSSGTSWTS